MNKAKAVVMHYAVLLTKYRIHSTGTVEELITDQIRGRSVSEDPTE